jgi:hypothetical protein
MKMLRPSDDHTGRAISAGAGAQKSSRSTRLLASTTDRQSWSRCRETKAIVLAGPQAGVRKLPGPRVARCSPVPLAPTV